MSKKNKTETVIKNLNLDIVYDKLAEAIIKAQMEAKEQKKKTEDKVVELSVLKVLCILGGFALCIFVAWLIM